MCIAKYHRHAGLVESIIKKWWKILQRNSKYAYLFKQSQRFVYCKGKIIGNQLVSSDLESKKVSKKV